MFRKLFKFTSKKKNTSNKIPVCVTSEIGCVDDIICVPGCVKAVLQDENLLGIILKYLGSATEILRASRVSKLWYRVASKPQTWYSYRECVNQSLSEERPLHDNDTEFASIVDKSKLTKPERYLYQKLEQTLFPECKIFFIRVIGFQWITYHSFFILYNGVYHALKTNYKNDMCTNFVLSEFILPPESMFPHVIPEQTFHTEEFPFMQQRFWQLYKANMLTDAHIMQIVSFIFVIETQDKQCNRRGIPVLFPVQLSKELRRYKSLDKNKSYSPIIARTPSRLTIKNFLSINWGGGYWVMGGHHYKAYEVDFSLEANKFEFQMKVLDSDEVRGRAMS